jgi:hypothetical protein
VRSVREDTEPASADAGETAPTLTDQQARRLWRRLETVRPAGSSLILETADNVVEHSRTVYSASAED